MNVIVLNMRGQPLMPCAPAKARKLLKAGKAVVVRKWPFAIQLKIATGENRQFTDWFPLPPFPFALPNRPKAGFENHLVWFRKYTAREMKACPHDKGPMELKIVHTMQVVDLARSICHSEGLEKQETYISLLSALYHDVGRFLQYRLWQSFRDRKSANHGLIGESILKFSRVLGNEPNEVKAEVTKAVRWHNAAEIPEGMQESVALKVVRDADKIDILRVTCTDDVQTVLGITEDELLASAVSPATEDAFFEHRCVRRDERTEPADYLVALACFTYELVYPASLEIALDQGFIFQPFERPFGIERPFTNRATAQLMNRMDGHLRAWVDEQI